ncbi:MAG: hypothetical protein AAGA80_02135 [Cyanobacteria bacterium P01_F01_bin.143]
MEKELARSPSADRCATSKADLFAARKADLFEIAFFCKQLWITFK